jgi:hypothetical protein
VVNSAPQNCRLDIGPRQVAVAVFAVALSLFLGIGELLASDTTAVGGIAAGLGKIPNIACLQHDRQCQNLADAWDRQQNLKFRTQLDLWQYRLFNRSNLLGQKTDGLHLEARRKAQLGVGKEGFDVGRRIPRLRPPPGLAHPPPTFGRWLFGSFSQSGRSTHGSPLQAPVRPRFRQRWLSG